LVSGCYSSELFRYPQVSFLALYWIADVKQKAQWFNVLRSVGTNMLLCQLTPYFLYRIFTLTYFYFRMRSLLLVLVLPNHFVCPVLCDDYRAV
jgi:hypothetical protein